MAQIIFLAGEGSNVNDLGGSGLGFYGDAGFGASVQVGQYQGRTFITNGAGTIQGPECDNVKYTHPSSGLLGQAGNSILLRDIPNQQSTLNIRFVNDTPVKLQNSQVRIFDRVNVNNPASGVTTKTAQIIHPNTVQGPGGSGDLTWLTPGGSAVIHNLTPSPGLSGLSPNGPDTNSLQHDYYLAISASPDSVGSKTQYALLFSTEYL